MVYYGYSYFYIFFLFFLFLLLFLIILSPNYSKKDVVPPLTTQNYGIDVSSFTGNNSEKNDSNATFITLKIQDGEGGSGGSALDFGGSGPDTVPVDFNTEYEYKNRRVTGYFVLYLENSNLNTPLLTTPPSFLFRVVDTHDSDYNISKNTLGDYNKGFAGLTMTSSEIGEHQPLYKVVVPFDVPSQKEGHNLQVQIAPMMNSTNIRNGDILLNSAYIYYY